MLNPNISLNAGRHLHEQRKHPISGICSSATHELFSWVPTSTPCLGLSQTLPCLPLPKAWSSSSLPIRLAHTSRTSRLYAKTRACGRAVYVFVLLYIDIDKSSATKSSQVQFPSGISDVRDGGKQDIISSLCMSTSSSESQTVLPRSATESTSLTPPTLWPESTSMTPPTIWPESTSLTRLLLLHLLPHMAYHAP